MIVEPNCTKCKKKFCKKFIKIVKFRIKNNILIKTCVFKKNADQFEFLLNITTFEDNTRYEVYRDISVLNRQIY